MKGGNVITETVDRLVGRAVSGLAGFIPNRDIRAAVEREWDVDDIDPTPTRIGRSCARLGLRPWKTGGVRGYWVEGAPTGGDA